MTKTTDPTTTDSPNPELDAADDNADDNAEVKSSKISKLKEFPKLKELKPHQIVIGIGIFMAIFTAASGIVSAITDFEGDSGITRKVFGNIPVGIKIAFYTLIPVVLIFVAVLFANRVRNWQRGVPDERRITFKNLKTRMADFRAGVYMKTLLKEPGAGTMHSLMYFSFLVLLAVTTTLEIDHQLPTGLKFLHGQVYQAYSAVGDLAGLIFVIAVVWAILRRFGPRNIRPYRIRGKNKPEYAIILITFFAIGVTGFLAEAFRIANEGTPGFEKWSFIGYPLATLVDGWGNIAGWHQAWWILHIVSFVVFLVILPLTMLRHIFTSPLNMWLKDRERPKGAMRPLPNLMETELETFGAATVEDFTWKQLLDTDSCTMCGRCTDVCPAHFTGKPLDPREIVLKTGEVMAATGTPPVRPPIGTDFEITISASNIFERVTSEEVWSCTSCRACDEACPVNIEILDKILDMRRHLSLMESDFPTELGNAYRSMENQGNPWGMSQSDRTTWTIGLEGVKIVEGGDPLQSEYLYWVGCAGSFDDKNQKVTKAMAELLTMADVSFSILGPSETCTGDPARRSGNEYIFQMLASQNVETLNAMGVKKIITQCPHCFNTLANEYPQLGGHYEVIHHSELLEKLIDSGDLDASQAELDERIVYHDACYLGRHNDIYMAPRRVVGSIAGVEVVEAPRNGVKGMCCGGGGARMWMEEHTGKQVNVERSQELIATGASRIATACPFCYVMIDDGVKGEGLDEEEVQVGDIALHLLEAIKKGEKNQVTNGATAEAVTEAAVNLVGSGGDQPDEIQIQPEKDADGEMALVDSVRVEAMDTKSTHVPKTSQSSIPIPTVVPAPSPPKAPPQKSEPPAAEAATTETAVETAVEAESEKADEAIGEDSPEATKPPAEEKSIEKKSAEEAESGETQTSQATPDSETSDTEKTEADKQKELATPPTPTPGKPDNLSLIKGLSPQHIYMLSNREIVSFAQIAELSDEQVLELEDYLGSPGRIQKWGWVEQAKMLLEDS